MPLIPADAGIQLFGPVFAPWFPAFAGMSGKFEPEHTGPTAGNGPGATNGSTLGSGSMTTNPSSLNTAPGASGSVNPTDPTTPNTGTPSIMAPERR